jgi:protein-tyrosine phosphatase
LLSSRVIKFEKVCNFRDMGGFKTEAGGTMKTGILFRSDELSRLSFRDQKTLRQLNLKLICDLRTPSERKRKLDRIPGKYGIRIVNIPIYPHREDFSRQKFIHYLNSKSDGYDFENLIKEYYRRFAFEQTDKLNEVISLLSHENNLPALIHCSVGKDRTGLMSALIQLFAGVPRSVVLEDYLISNSFIEERTKAMIRFLRFMSLFRISSAQLKPMLEVRSVYLNEILDEILQTYGTVEEFFTKACGIEQSSIQKLRNLILE